MAGTAETTGRRRFVAGLVGGTAAAAGGTAALTGLTLSTSDESWGGRVRYRGVRPLDGPADRALPQVPVRVDADGYLHGRFPGEGDGQVPTTTLGGVRYSAEWFRYCGAERHPGLRPGADQGTALRAAPDPPNDWQRTALTPGERLHVSHFSDYADWGNGVGTDGLGKPAMATWRSRGVADPIHVQVVRSRRVPELRDAGGDWLSASTEGAFVAWRAECTGWCALTAFKGYEASETFGAGDLVYDPRNQSTFDPFDVVADTMVTPEWAPG